MKKRRPLEEREIVIRLDAADLMPAYEIRFGEKAKDTSDLIAFARAMIMGEIETIETERDDEPAEILMR